MKKINRRRFGQAALAAGAAAVLPRFPARADTASAPPPGVAVAHMSPLSRAYVGSPGLAALPDGTCLAKHDLFGPGSTESTVAITRLYRSSDRGASWSFLAEVRGMYWSSIFTRGSQLFMIGTDRQYGNAVAMRSDDNGATWTRPVGPGAGRILPAGHYHTAPVPVLFYRGRIWRAMEQMGPVPGLRRFRALMMSVPEDADLLDSRSWTATNTVSGGFRHGGWLEGNAVAAPDGTIVNILRVESAAARDDAVMLRVDDHGSTLLFDPKRDLIRLPGGDKKFTIRWDPKSGFYWSLVNPAGPEGRGMAASAVRNTLALVRSSDLREWETRAVVLHHPDPKRHAFQYVDWLFDREDLIALSRTAWDDADGGAPRAHDANFLTFHRIENFRELTGMAGP